jgi:hypothetical protein
VLRWLRHITVAVILGVSAYIGFGNTDDITNTITIWQRLVGVTATAYAILAVAAFVGYARCARWLGPVLWVWGALLVFTSVLASLVYGATGGANVLVLLASAVLPALTLWASWGRARENRTYRRDLPPRNAARRRHSRTRP